MTTTPEISIVLPVYNGARYLRESIDSCLAQTFRNWELIIVNDCSTDESGAIAKEYAAKDKRIRVIHNETNLKLPASLNVGFRQAKGEYLTWTSDDNRYLPHALQRMIDFLHEHPKYIMVCTAFQYIDEAGEFVDATRFDSTFVPLRDHMLCHGGAIGACFLYHRSVLQTVGEYDAKWFLVEDYEYWLRIASKQHAIAAIHEVCYLYRRHSLSLTSREREIGKKDVAMRLTYWEKLNHTLSYEDRKIAIKNMLVRAGINSFRELKTFASEKCFTHPHDRMILYTELVRNSCKMPERLLRHWIIKPIKKRLKAA